MNNFSGEGKHLKLMATTFQNMFPTINLATVSEFCQLLLKLFKHVVDEIFAMK